MRNYQNNETLKSFTKTINDQRLDGQHLVKASTVLGLLNAVGESYYNQGVVDTLRKDIELLEKLEGKL